jgi:hypothetical protein
LHHPSPLPREHMNRTANRGPQPAAVRSTDSRLPIRTYIRKAFLEPIPLISNTFRHSIVAGALRQ